MTPPRETRSLPIDFPISTVSLKQIMHAPRVTNEYQVPLSPPSGEETRQDTRSETGSAHTTHAHPPFTVTVARDRGAGPTKHRWDAGDGVHKIALGRGSLL